MALRLALPIALLLLPTSGRVPERQTPFQAELVASVDRAAASASAAATPLLLRALDTPSFRAGLTRCCPAIARESSKDLLSRLDAELETAEMTHNFNANSTGSWEGDVNISIASRLRYLPNLWTLRFLNLSSAAQRVEDISEVDIMGFRAFSGGQPVGNATPLTFDEAAERPLYTTANLFRLPTGDAEFGDVSVVMRPSYAQPLALLEPVDTGNYQESCNVSVLPTSCAHFPAHLDCTAWPAPHVQGTYAHHAHILLANARLWRPCAGDVLLHVFDVLYGTGSAVAFDRSTFVEPDLAGTIQFPHGVKLIVAEFSSLFGSAIGEAVRALCKRWGWVLSWALSAQTRRAANVSAAAPPRALDPAALAATTVRNLSVPAAHAEFEAVWHAVQVQRGAGPVAPTSWAHYWSLLPATLALSSGLRAGQCADADACVGVRPRDGDCVCYGSSGAGGVVESRGAHA